MNVTIVNRNSGTRKECRFEGFPGGKHAPWFQVRWPNFGGCYNFSLETGWIEHKRSEDPEWYVLESDLVLVRAEAKKEGLVFNEYPRVLPARKPRKPRRGGGDLPQAKGDV